MAISYKDLTHTGDEIDAGITLIDSHAANTSIHVSLLDRESWDSKQAALVIGTNFDANPTENSTYPVSSGGVFSALSGKQATLVAGTNMDSTPTSGSSNPVTSGGVFNGLSGKQATLIVGTNLDNSVISGSTNPVTSGGVYGAMIGTELSPPSGATWHLRDYLTPGVYRVTGATPAARFDDTPVNDRGFVMIVQQLSTDAYYCQTIIPAVNQSMADHFWRRHYRGTGNTSGQKGFSNWYEYAGTDTGSGAYIPAE